MLTLISIVFQFVVTAANPSWSCVLTHRDPSVAGTYYFYCSQRTHGGIELIQVGRFISDVHATGKVTP